MATDDWIIGVEVIAEFACHAAAMACDRSDAYAEATGLRLAGTPGAFMIAEGLRPWPF